ncbi:MAG: transglycosylase domain-containing protein, partial [bacterium]
MKKLRKYLWWLVLAPFLLILLLQLYYFAQIGLWVVFNPSSTSFMQAQLEQLREKNPKTVLKQQWVPYQQISKNLKRAIIVSEDALFAEHQGVDWDALEKAYLKNTRKGRVVAGGST